MHDRYLANKKAAVFYNTEPTMTDQSQARETDINVIVKTFARTGQAVGTSQPPAPPADYTVLPEDFRGFIEMARSVAKHRAALPQELQHFSTDELVRLTPDEIRKILTPPAPTPAPTEEPKK